MDDKTRQLLRDVPEWQGRSKLTPHKELISALRMKRRSYAEIAAVLKREFGLVVAPSSINDFVRVRSRIPAVRYELPSPSWEELTTGKPPASDVRARIEAFKNRPRPAPPPPRKRFEFDETKPLTLIPRTTEKN